MKGGLYLGGRQFYSPTHLNQLLNSTSHTRILKHAAQIQTQIIINNFSSLIFLSNNLLNLYAKCGHITQTLLLFSTNTLPKNIVTWTSLITHFSHLNKPIEALTYFNHMRRTSLYPNEFTFSAILPACANSMLLLNGKQLHTLITKHGFDNDVFVATALLHMYAKCGNVALAKNVFDVMPQRNIVTWNSMIVGFLQNNLYDVAIQAFVEIHRVESIVPDQVSFSSLLSACANKMDSSFGRQVHALAVKHGLVTTSAYVSNSLMDMYCKCGLFNDATRLFQTSGDLDVVAWNVMIMGCVHNNNFEQACNYFWAMCKEGVSPDEASYSSALHASASVASLYQGTMVHDLIMKTGFMRNSCVASSLITMYAKCGSITDASRIFEALENRTVVCWTAIVAAFQQHGHANKVIELYEEMVGEAIQPDYITFVCVLSACSHTGRVKEGYDYFNSMTKLYGIMPGHEHYACMVDLLGRAGRLDEARNFIESMPTKPDASVWGALLGACASYGNLELGRDVANRLFELEPNNPGNYVLLCNMYTCQGKLKEADEVRRLMGIKGVRKSAGCSWIDVKNETFVFNVNDRSHPRTDEIYEMLRKVKDKLKNKGYVAETQFAVNSTNRYKERSLWYHSEKLAFAFGLLVLPAKAPITIKKNLRTCGDCHTVMKLASEIFEREIILRDINRFHRFNAGSCSCGDYW